MFIFHNHYYFLRFKQNLCNTFFFSFQRIPLVITARLFDHPINNLSRKQLIELVRDTKTGMIACHRIYATVSQR